MANAPLMVGEQLLINNGEGTKIAAPLNLSASAGNIVSIIGPDHDRKSCCLQTLGGIIEAESGHLYLAGKDVMQHNKAQWVATRTQFGYVHTDTAVLSAANALQNLMLPAMYHKTGEASEIREKARRLLLDIDAGDNLELLPAHLKKEQRYKIAVARALMLEPLALLLDEPFAALEMSSVRPFKQFLLCQASAAQRLLVLVTHDIEFALQYSDQIIYLSQQKLLQFDHQHRIQDCDDPEVRDYLTI